ncbi:receptor-type tyrosine-protein phosphatase kappa-like [Ptychodera flava]|uniref:receptor-type tyrosine-protein phosphatase kappa-like n=1 Tax=Ptychodera flava TaxID=63121 RepID=UPI00396A96D8
MATLVTFLKLAAGYLCLLHAVVTGQTANCDFVPVDERISCNEDGGGQSACVSVSCCFQSVQGPYPWCSFPEKCSIPENNRTTCGSNINSAIDCLDHGCCWYKESGNSECFLSTTCAITSGNRIDCGNSNDLMSCLDSGCCYDDSTGSDVPNCYRTIGCVDGTYYNGSQCVSCHCKQPCDKNTGVCPGKCDNAHIGSTCQQDGTTSILDFQQDFTAIGNSGQPSRFTCTVQGNEIDPVDITLTTPTYSYSHSSSTGGSHPDYEIINMFDDVIVNSNDTVTCVVNANAGDDEKQTTAAAYVQPQLLSAPWVTDIKEREMTVEWKQWNENDDYGTGPVIHYELWYKNTSDSDFVLYPGSFSTPSANVYNLQPYRQYSFAVRTFRIGEGGGGGLSPAVTNSTLCDDPLGSPVLQDVHTIGETQIRVSWKVIDSDLLPEVLQCDVITSYTIHYTSGDDSSVLVREVNSMSTTSVVDNLDPCTQYTFSVTMENDVGRGPNSNYMHNTTLTSVPQPVTKLSSTPLTSGEIEVKWEAPSSIECPLEGYELTYEQSTDYECGELRTYAPKILNTTTLEETLRALYPFTEYAIEVRAFTSGGFGAAEIELETTEEEEPSAPGDVLIAGVSDKALNVSWTIPECRNGSIKSYKVRYMETGNETMEQEVIEISVNNITYNIIDGLRPSTNYTVQVLAENGCCISQPSMAATGVTATSPDGGLSSGVVAGLAVSGCLFLLLLIAALLLFLYARRTGKDWKEVLHLKSSKDTSALTPSTTMYENPAVVTPSDYENITKENGKKSRYSGPTTSLIKDANANGVTEKEHSHTTKTPKPIKIDELAEYVQMKRAEGENLGLRAEYNMLPSEKTGTWKASAHEVNKVKNRFVNIVAYDHSRVVLENVENIPNSDYINASYIDGYGKKKAYIATQGPKPETVDDFWRMIWQEKTVSILMATNLVEHGKTKCVQYWPDIDEGERVCGQTLVKHVGEERFVDAVIRTFHIQNVNEDRSREVKQFHFTVWPDMGVPLYTSGVLSILKRIREYTTPKAGPLVVHCSAGVGRTGTFITIDAMLQMAEAEGKIDIFNFVKQARKNRPQFVQTWNQYTFIYTAVLEETLCGDTRINPADFRIRLDELKRRDNKTGISELEGQFENLTKICPSPTKEECKNGLKEENIHKNRYPNILPLDLCRPLLMTQLDNVEPTNYINASFLTAYTRKDAFIATQMPMEHTIVDFWRMVYDYKTSTIVMLNDMKTDDMKNCQYWSDTEELQYGPFVVEVKSVEEHGDITERTIRLTITTKSERPRTIKHLHLHSWSAEQDIPNSKSVITDMMSMVDKAQQKFGNNPVTVHCRNGIGRSGVFCAISSACESVKVEETVDVLQAVKMLRINRPGMVETITQYEYCYDAIQEYFDSFSTYSNFER